MSSIGNTDEAGLHNTAEAEDNADNTVAEDTVDNSTAVAGTDTRSTAVE